MILRLSTRTALVAATTLPLAVAAPALASAADASDVTYSYTVDGSTVTNTITNNSGVALTCATALADAPGGVLPPVADAISGGHTLGAAGEVLPGTSNQIVTDIPGSYVVLATCSRQDSEPTMWVSAYPGIEEYLTAFPATAYTVERASTVVTIAGDETTPPSLLPDLGALFGS